MTKEELDAIQDKMYSEMISMPEEQEKLMNDTANYVAQRLFFKANEKVKVEFYEHKYVFIATKQLIDFKENIWMVVVDENDIVNNSSGDSIGPRVFNVVAEIDNTLSTVENYRACVLAFLRHQTGEYLPEELEED